MSNSMPHDTVSAPGKTDASSAPKVNRLSLVCLRLGVLSYLFGLLTGIPALIVGFIALGQMKKRRSDLSDEKQGRVMVEQIAAQSHEALVLDIGRHAVVAGFILVVLGVAMGLVTVMALGSTRWMIGLTAAGVLAIAYGLHIYWRACKADGRKYSMIAGVILGVFILIIPIFSHGAFLRVQERTQRSLSQINLKSIDRRFKMYAIENRYDLWPAYPAQAGRLAPCAEALFPSYLTVEDLVLFTSPGHQPPKKVREAASTDPSALIDDYHYIYLAYVVYDEPSGLDFIAAYEHLVTTGESFDNDVELGETIVRRLREGVERFYINNESDYETSAQMRSRILVMFERPGLRRGGGNVLFMDGSIKFRPTGTFPYTETFLAGIEKIETLDGQPPSAAAQANPNKTVEVVSGERLEPGTEKNVAGIEMVWIPPGTFTMGSPEEEQDRYYGEGPQHEVTFRRGFWLGKYEVTQAQWEAVMGNNPSHFTGDGRLPVEQVSWDDVQEFIKKLNTKGEGNFRLPTEAEWEYACRAGTTTPFSFGATLSTDEANYDGDYTYGAGRKGVYRGQTTAVGSFPGNAWGLYDMHGNVWEWCEDDCYYTYVGAPDGGSAWVDLPRGSGRMVRGGSWIDSPGDCRSASRGGTALENRNFNLGFRLALPAVQGGS